MDKNTMVIGASPNIQRYSHRATLMLKEHGHTVYPLGVRKGFIKDTEILLHRPQLDDIHTVTMYVGKSRQDEWIDYILSINPQRLIFNPGTPNDAFGLKASSKGIEVIEACTLVMLSIGNY